MYWENSTYVPALSTTMIRNRFDEIFSIFHFNGNTTAFPATSPNHSKLHKFKPLSTISETNLWRP